MVPSSGRDARDEQWRALIISAIMLLVVTNPLFAEFNEGLSESFQGKVSRTSSEDPWYDGNQPWPQPGRFPG